MEELNKEVIATYDYDSFYKYAAGYYDCGMTLIDNLLDSDRYRELSRLHEEFRKESIKLEEECNIYPVMFLFRQYMELIIKALYVEFEIVDPHTTFHIHKISELWPPLKKKLFELANEYEGEHLDETIEILDDIIKKFAIIDDDSYCFRYPVNTSGNPYFKDDKTYNLYEIKYDIREFNELIHEFL